MKVKPGDAHGNDGRWRGRDEVMRIGELSQATGASTRALRYYEEQELIRSERLPNGYRDYRPGAIDTVEFIQDLLAAGLSSRLLRDIMPCVAGDHRQAPCADLVARVQQVRDGLMEQEQRIRARRETLDQYLTGQRKPRGNWRTAPGGKP